MNHDYAWAMYNVCWPASQGYENEEVQLYICDADHLGATKLPISQPYVHIIKTKIHF